MAILPKVLINRADYQIGGGVALRLRTQAGVLAPVFDAMLEKAMRLCESTFGGLTSYDDGHFHTLALRGMGREAVEAFREPWTAGPGSYHEKLVRGEWLVHTEFDLNKARQAHPQSRAVFEEGARTLLLIGLRKQSALLGSLWFFRKEVRPYSDQQIALLQNFAAQAVIAIENARLLNDLRHRTEEVETLNQHLEQRVADQVGEIERMGRLRRFLPPQVADLIVASGTEKQLESHRREITALFCDLRGFTGFTESADAEDVMALLRDYHAATTSTAVPSNAMQATRDGDLQRSRADREPGASGRADGARNA
jgi:GAF domain-containing protein